MQLFEEYLLCMYRTQEGPEVTKSVFLELTF